MKNLSLIVIVVGVILGFYWLMWKLWCWVLPQVWAGGPEGLVAPGYWLFVGAALLLSFVGKTLFGRSEAGAKK